VGRIVASVTVANAATPSERLRCNALVDTGASYLTLPVAWRERLGELELVRTVEMETATQEAVQGEVCGPVRIEVEGFDPVFSEVLFVDMTPEQSTYEPLFGYIVLEQSQTAVDPLGQRLVHAGRMDLK
jgi:predicted aspartyl protease